MADFAKLLDKFNPDPSKAGNTLLILNVAGMIFAALSNTFAAATDKNTSKEDKKFLVPAGLATGVANIGAYFAITTKIIDKLAGKEEVVKDGKVIKQATKGFIDTVIEKMEKEGTLETSAKNLADKAINKAEKGGFLGLGKKSDEYVSSMKETLKDDSAQIALFKDNMKAGAGVLGAFAGAVIGCAIITPIIRDVSAYFIQKKMEKNNPNLKNEPPRPYFDPTHTKVNGNLRKLSSMRDFMISTNGRMKI